MLSIFMVGNTSALIRCSGLLPTYQHRTVLPVLGHTPQITLALGGLIGRHSRPRELEDFEGLDAPRPIALESRQTNPAPLVSRVD